MQNGYLLFLKSNINLSSNRNKMKGQEQHKIEWQILFLLCHGILGVQIAIYIIHNIQ